MKTDDLIDALKADNQKQRPSPGLVFAMMLLASILVAGGLLVSTMGIRPDFVAVLDTVRFPFKFVVTLALAVSAAVVFHRTLFPVASRRPHPILLLVAPAIMLLGVVVELMVLPPGAWVMAAQGKNAMLCLTVVPVLGALPLGLMLWGLRQGATTRPVLGGLFAGILAGGIAATFYAAHCTDDSPLFVATWYPIAVLLLGIAGAGVGSLVARW